MTIPESVIAFLLLFLCLLLFYRIFLCFSGKKRASDFPSDCVSGASKTIGDREVQEDEYGIKTAPEGIMAVLADGMGKHFGGKIAAGTAVEAFLQIFEDGSAFYNPQYSFRRAFQGANREILNRLERGCTLVQAETGFCRNAWPMVLTVVSGRELPRLTRMIQEIDPEAFLMISRVSEVRGHGFTLGKVYRNR